MASVNLTLKFIWDMTEERKVLNHFEWQDVLTSITTMSVFVSKIEVNVTIHIWTSSITTDKDNSIPELSLVTNMIWGNKQFYDRLSRSVMKY